jgi:hypothetical protein
MVFGTGLMFAFQRKTFDTIQSELFSEIVNLRSAKTVAQWGHGEFGRIMVDRVNFGGSLIFLSYNIKRKKGKHILSIRSTIAVL